MRVAILGCGPAGLIAAAAALPLADVAIFSRNRKSDMYGAQYLHQPIPGYTDPSACENISYNLKGTVEGYRTKVYGEKFVGSVSVEDLQENHMGWNIRDTYDALWETFKFNVQDTHVTPPFVLGLLSQNDIDLVVNSIPAPELCYQDHTFRSVNIWAAGEAPEIGIKLPYFADPNTVICNGDEYPSWYRLANVFGRTTVEWPGHISKPPIRSVSKVRKPIGHNCDCWDHPKFVSVGRYGCWSKEVLSHTAYDRVYRAVTERLSV